MGAKETIQKIQLVDGCFSPSEALDMIEEIIDGRIKFHNIQMLRMWEGNHHFDSSYWDKKMEELKQEMKTAFQLIREAKKEGFQVEICGHLEVRPVRKVVNSVKINISNN